MESQPPPAPFSATGPRQKPQLSASTTPDCYEYEYSEKDAYPYAHPAYSNSRTERNSRSSYGRAHDSVISPFSPKCSSPPSPRSSVSSAARKHPASSVSVPEIRYSTSNIERHSVQYPPQVHLDPEKHAHRSSQGGRSSHRLSASGLDAPAIVYDQGKYHEKGPEDKAWQLLVCVIPTSCSLHFFFLAAASDGLLVLLVWPLCTAFRCYYPMDTFRCVGRTCPSAPTHLHQAAFTFRTTQDLSCSSAEPATSSCLQPRLQNWV